MQVLHKPTAYFESYKLIAKAQYIVFRISHLMLVIQRVQQKLSNSKAVQIKYELHVHHKYQTQSNIIYTL